MCLFRLVPFAHRLLLFTRGHFFKKIEILHYCTVRRLSRMLRGSRFGIVFLPHVGRAAVASLFARGASMSWPTMRVVNFLNIDGLLNSALSLVFRRTGLIMCLICISVLSLVLIILRSGQV